MDEKERMDITLMISNDLFRQLKVKHRKKLLQLGFIPNQYFDYTFFDTYNIIFFTNTISSFRLDPVISYLYANNSLSDENKTQLKNILNEILECGICPINLHKKDLFLSKDGKLTFFVTDGLVSSSLKVKSIYSKEKLKNKIDNFLKSV